MAWSIAAKGGFNSLTVPDCEARGLEVAKFPCAFGRVFAIPREQRGEWKEEFENTSSDDTHLRCERVSGDQ